MGGIVPFSHFYLARVDGIPAIPAPGYIGFWVLGGFFNIPDDQMNYWVNPGRRPVRYSPTATFPPGFLPKALKFTFKIYDSKGIIENGRTFTHIVYLDE